MFSSEQLISYVFSTPGEEYRGNDLMTRNLNQHLWKSLHRDYHTVYFLQSQDGYSFSVHTFGDRDAKRYKPPIFASPEKRFGEWLLEQLCLPQSEAVAFVCPLDVFCRVFSRDAWAPVLEQIVCATGRTGIFVLTASPYAEDSQELLLSSPVFEWLKETTVTENRGTNRCIYTAIRKEKPQHYRCMNAFTPEQIDNLLLHICAEDPVRCISPEDRQRYAENLAAHLSEGRPLPWLPASAQQSLYLTYRELYQQLRHRDAWNQMIRLPSCLSIPNTPAILRSPNCYAAKCLKLQLPDWIQGMQDADGQFIGDILEDALADIRRTLCNPFNRQESPQLVETACSLIQQFRDLHEGDADTCILLIRALRFCVGRVTVSESAPKYPDIINILNSYVKYINISNDLFRREQNLSRLESNLVTASGMDRLNLPTYHRELERDKYDLHSCVEYLNGTIFMLENCGISTEVRDHLHKAMRDYEFSENRTNLF